MHHGWPLWRDGSTAQTPTLSPKIRWLLCVYASCRPNGSSEIVAARLVKVKCEVKQDIVQLRTTSTASEASHDPDVPAQHLNWTDTECPSKMDSVWHFACLISGTVLKPTQTICSCGWLSLWTKHKNNIKWYYFKKIKKAFPQST